MQEENRRKIRKNILRYGITLLVGLGMSIGISIYRGLSSNASLSANLGALSDGFFFSAALIGGVGLLVWISTTGFFDMLGYAFKNVSLLAPFRRKYKHQSFYEYKTEKSEKRGKPLFFLLICGLILLVLSLLCLVGYSNL